jgi:hypothetical protein
LTAVGVDPERVHTDKLSGASSREQRPGLAARQSIGRPKALDKSKAELARRMHVSGESAGTIAATLKVSRATVYRVLAEPTDQRD